MVLGKAGDVYKESHCCGCSGKGFRLEDRPIGGGGR